MRPERQAAEREQKELRRAAGEADLIGLATILKVGPPPLAWSSSHALSFQSVGLRLDEVWKGRLRPGTEVEANFALLEGSELAEPDEPKLKASIFQVGAQHIVFLDDVEGVEWQYHDETHTALPPTERHRVRRALRLE